jgi:hypothetical protein
LIRRATVILTAAVLFSPLFAEVSPSDRSWIATSNGYADKLLKVRMKHHPEEGSSEGLAQYDTLASQPTLEDEDREREETEAVLTELKVALSKEPQKEVAEDLEIMIRSVELDLRVQDFTRVHKVTFLNASGMVFEGMRVLLDEQTPPERRPSAVARLSKYAGLEKGYQPIAEILEGRVLEQIAKPGVVYPSRSEIETELSRDSNYLEGIAQLLEKYHLTGWQEPFHTLSDQLRAYDDWTRKNVLPRARSDFRLLPQEYALRLEQYGVDIPPDRLAELAHTAFSELQSEMKPIAESIATQLHLQSSDYRDVIRELKKHQLVGDEILPFYRDRLKQIEQIIVDKQIVTLPDRPARIRLATAAETAQEPAPHMVPPPFLHNTGQKGEFVLPLNLPPSPGGKPAEKYDDFTFDAAAWTLTAHEVRPGHELQFDSMLEQGVSEARVEYAFNSTNVEGWGLYSEYLMLPYMPLEGQLVSLDYRLMRAARAFLDPELQAGKIQPEDAKRILEQDVVASPAFAEEEVERYTYQAPGQANSYFYGYSKILALRHETERALGTKFNPKRFHDFILSQGLLPPDMLRKAVTEDFIQHEQN